MEIYNKNIIASSKNTEILAVNNIFRHNKVNEIVITQKFSTNKVREITISEDRILITIYKDNILENANDIIGYSEYDIIKVNTYEFSEESDLNLINLINKNIPKSIFIDNQNNLSYNFDEYECDSVLDIDNEDYDDYHEQMSDDECEAQGMIYCCEDGKYHDAEEAWMYDGSVY